MSAPNKYCTDCKGIGTIRLAQVSAIAGEDVRVACVCTTRGVRPRVASAPSVVDWDAELQSHAPGWKWCDDNSTPSFCRWAAGRGREGSVVQRRDTGWVEPWGDVPSPVMALVARRNAADPASRVRPSEVVGRVVAARNDNAWESFPAADSPTVDWEDAPGDLWITPKAVLDAAHGAMSDATLYRWTPVMDASQRRSHAERSGRVWADPPREVSIGYSGKYPDDTAIRAELAREELADAGVDVSRWTTGDLVSHYDGVIAVREGEAFAKSQDERRGKALDYEVTMDAVAASRGKR